MGKVQLNVFRQEIFLEQTPHMYPQDGSFLDYKG